ncbi:MAG: coniferyl aldehyde dehydrogenase, partial [Myxococcales bacterium]|nr:coniferyl aldehyde dehydrogenase [Myxococcota bacterium]MDW8282395.1 coniferyl aldehyde dehydrogenase [Myxococcales bacterium]
MNSPEPLQPPEGIGEAPSRPSANHLQAAMQAALGRQREAFLREGPPSLKVRLDRLDRALSLLLRHQDEICNALSADFGHRSREQTLITDVMVSVRALRHAMRHVRHWMRPERRAVDFPLNLVGAQARIEYQPKGVVGLISPWNFPISLIFVPLAGILSAGNRVMIKPSELTPTTSDLVARLLAGAFSEAEVAVFVGGPEVGAAFCRLPFDHLMYTGSTAVGRLVMRAAAENLVPLTLELGGKSPVVISRSADLADAATKIMAGKMLNAGQVCLAPDYVLLPEESVEPFVAHAQAAVRRMFPSLRDNPDYTSVINERHVQRLRAYLEDARSRGARLVEINPAGEDFSQQSAHKLPPTLLLDVTDDMKVMQEEIFGPLLPLRPYRWLSEAIEYINSHDRPLALYYFGHDPHEEERVLHCTVSGGVTINDVIMHFVQQDLPFGGIGPSGMGRYGGVHGFREFSHARAVYTQTRLRRVLDLMRPP